MENVMVALHTLEVLIQNGYNITPAQIEKGLRTPSGKAGLLRFFQNRFLLQTEPIIQMRQESWFSL